MYHGKRVGIFGWKESKQPELLEKCYRISKILASNDYSIITGGGGGFMESANKGAFEVCPYKSFGVGVSFLKKEKKNNYILDENYFKVYDFYSRKIILLTDAYCLIFFNGGIGTLDEFSEIINLIKTDERIKKPKLVCFGTTFWKSLQSLYLQNGLNDPLEKIDLVTDDIQETIDFILC